MNPSNHEPDAWLAVLAGQQLATDRATRQAAGLREYVTRQIEVEREHQPDPVQEARLLERLRSRGAFAPQPAHSPRESSKPRNSRVGWLMNWLRPSRGRAANRASGQTRHTTTHLQVGSGRYGVLQYGRNVVLVGLSAVFASLLLHNYAGFWPGEGREATRSSGIDRALPQAGAINRVALLIGAGEYADPNINSLSGPPNDAIAMKSVLVRRWGFAQEDIKILNNKDATRANILKEMAALKTRSQPGDEVLVYFSGHGSSARDSRQTLPIPGSSGAWIPTDFKATNPKLRDLILARTDLYPVFSQLEQGGRKLWVIVDACFSGQAARNAQNNESPENAESPPRMIDLKIGQAALAEQAMLQTASQFSAPAPWPYQSTVYLAAAAEGEVARDLKGSAARPPATLDGKPHGAFTDALLRVLEGQLPADSDGDGFMSLTEVQRATSAFMDLKTYGHTPQRQPAVAEDENGLGSRPVLSVRDAAAKPKTAEAYYFHLYYENLPEKISTAVAGVPDVVKVTSQAKADIVLKLAENGQLNFLAASGDLIAEVPKANLLQITAQVRQLAWAYRLQASAKSRARGVLAAEITPSGTGGRFTPGQKIRFVARPDRAAALVLMNIDSTGKVSVLYPHNIGDTRLLGKDEAVYMPINNPGRCIWVKKPFGMDLQFIFAFDTPPTGLADLIGLADADPDNPKLHRFMQTLVQHERKFTFTSTKLRVVESDSSEKMVMDNRSCGD